LPQSYRPPTVALRFRSNDDPWSKHQTRLHAVRFAGRGTGDVGLRCQTDGCAGGGKRNDINKLRSHGFDDRDILNIVYVICLSNFNDRIADAIMSKDMIFFMADPPQLTIFASPSGSAPCVLTSCGAQLKDDHPMAQTIRKSSTRRKRSCLDLAGFDRSAIDRLD
jgi:hypothetical protein